MLRIDNINTTTYTVVSRKHNKPATRPPSISPRPMQNHDKLSPVMFRQRCLSPCAAEKLSPDGSTLRSENSIGLPFAQAGIADVYRRATVENKRITTPHCACNPDRPTAATLRRRSIVSRVSGLPQPAARATLLKPAGEHVHLPCRSGTSPGNPVPAHRIAGTPPVLRPLTGGRFPEVEHTRL